MKASEALLMHRTVSIVLVYRIADFCHEDFNVASHRIRIIKIRYIFHLVSFYHVTASCYVHVMSMLQYFAKKQVGSLSNSERTLSNA